jgi:hypothetical protein
VCQDDDHELVIDQGEADCSSVKSVDASNVNVSLFLLPKEFVLVVFLNLDNLS